MQIRNILSFHRLWRRCSQLSPLPAEELARQTAAPRKADHDSGARRLAAVSEGFSFLRQCRFVTHLLILLSAPSCVFRVKRCFVMNCHSSFPRNSLSYLAWFGLSDKVSWSQSRMFPTARGTVEHSRRVCCSVYTDGQHKDTCKLRQVIGCQHLRCPLPWWEMPVSTPVFLIPFLTNGQPRKGAGLASVTEFCRPHVTLGLHTRFLASGCPAPTRTGLWVVNQERLQQSRSVSDKNKQHWYVAITLGTGLKYVIIIKVSWYIWFW